VEGESIRAYPRVLGTILTVMEDFTVQTCISIVSSIFGTARELGKGKELGKTINGWLLELFLV
jgi:hypothetical protein